MPESQEIPKQNPKPDLNHVIESIGNIQTEQPLLPVKESDFNPRYVEATKVILNDFVSKNPSLHLNSDTLWWEYMQAYGIVTEQDHLDCLKLALKDSLKHIKEGKKILVATHSNPYFLRSQKLMSKVMYSLISDIAGPDNVSLIGQKYSTEIGIHDEIKEEMDKSGRPVNDFRILVADDAAYTGTRFYGFIQGIEFRIKDLTKEPLKNLDAYLAFDGGFRARARFDGINIQTIRRNPDPRPVRELKYFQNYLFGMYNEPTSNETTSVRGIVTAYRSPDGHSGPNFYKEWGPRSYEGVYRSDAQRNIMNQVELLTRKGVLRRSETIKAFENKGYPTPEYLVDKVKKQIGL